MTATQRTSSILCGICILVSSLTLVGASCSGSSTGSPQLVSEQGISEIGQASSICLDLQVDIPWRDSDEAATILQELFARIGLEVLGAEQDCDIDFRLQVSGDSDDWHVVEYLEDGDVVARHTVDPWARTEGELSLELPGYSPLALVIDNRGESESHADFFPQVLGQLANIWGPEIYRQAMHIPGLSAIARDALIILGSDGARILGELYLEAEPSSMYAIWEAFEMMGSEATEAIPSIIEAIGDGKKRLNEPAGLLRLITGEDFGNDSEAWLIWWQTK
jgi:hypothetical protein